jgi:hypothetical protein
MADIPAESDPELIDKIGSDFRFLIRRRKIIGLVLLELANKNFNFFECLVECGHAVMILTLRKYGRNKKAYVFTISETVSILGVLMNL